MRYWDNKEVPGRGTKFCLVIDPEDGTNPIRTYGWSEKEILEKVAKTAETAQAVISRQRTASSAVRQLAPVRTDLPPSVPKPGITTEERLQATNDLSNPAKSSQAVKTLLRGEGIDVDAMKFKEQTEQVARIGQEWEKRNPDFPVSDQNSRLLLDTAIRRIAASRDVSYRVAFAGVTAEALDEAYAELLSRNMLFDVESNSLSQPITPSTPPNGNSDSRGDRPRSASSYQRNRLSAQTPPAKREPPKYTRAEIHAMNNKEFQRKVLDIPEVLDWYNREFSQAATA
jgi:hypothetical protein